VKSSAILGVLGVCLLSARADSISARVSGKVLSETKEPVSAARLLLHCGSYSVQGTTDPTGGFELQAPRGSCVLTVEQEAYFPLKERPVEVEEQGVELSLVLTPRRERVETLEVSAEPVTIDIESPSIEQRLTNTELVNIPYPTTNNLQNALHIIPGVVQSDQEIHLNGGDANQGSYTLDGFNIADPLTGSFTSRVSVESVDSVAVSSGALPAELGKGSAGSLALRSRSGDDKFRLSATNFIPGVEFRKGIIIGNYTPRVNFSGPWYRGRAWFADSIDLQYDQQVVQELPVGSDRTTSWRMSNLLHNQFNITPSNILHATLLTTWWYAPHAGLGPLDPIETTVDRRARQIFVAVKDQIYFQRGALIEYGYAGNRTWGREVPQGRDFYLITADGYRGNYFRDSNQRSSRDQFLASAFLPLLQFKGAHQIKIGMDLDRLSYWQDIERTGFRYYRPAGTELRETIFRGNGSLEQRNAEVSVFVQDSWKVRPGLVIEGGLRWDWDQIVKHVNTGPRVGFAWSPARMEDMKISGGVGVIYDATNLQMFARPQDQFSITTYFMPDGTPVQAPGASLFRPAARELVSPGYLTFNAGIERRLPKALWLRVGYLGKRGDDGFTYWNTLWDGANPPPGLAAQLGVSRFDAIYQLTNRRQSQYDAFEVTARQAFHGQYEWMASYIRSSTRSNAALDVSIDQPAVIPDNSGPLPWDTPNRLLSWGYLPTPWKNWAAAYLMEWRTGFPYSIFGGDGTVIGGVNSQRFPAYFDLNLHAERRFTVHGYVLALRGGVNNVTGRQNPTVVNSILGAPNYGTYYGGSGRAVTFRLRWLGRN
jgi:hypothetical protein